MPLCGTDVKETNTKWSKGARPPEYSRYHGGPIRVYSLHKLPMAQSHFNDILFEIVFILIFLYNLDYQFSTLLACISNNIPLLHLYT